MNGRVEHNTALFTTNREQVILSLRKSLEPLLNKLSQEEVALDGKPQDVSDLDESIEGFLTFVGSKFSLWIFDSFMDSIALQTELWVSFFYPVVNRYRTEVVGKYKDNFQEKPVAASQAIKRFDKICKHVGHFYKQFVTRIVENFGYTPQLHYVVSILHLTPSRESSSPSANEKMAPAIHLSVHDSLCHMGDLSRYRTSNGFKSDHMDYTHALVYYTTAFKIQPSSGMPFNQLGNISYSTGDIFSGTYFFLRSVAVDEPFRDGSSNLRIILKKLLKIKDTSLPKLKIAGVDSAEPIADENGIDNGEDFEDVTNAKLRKSKENVAEVKENLMRLLQLYSNYYMSHLPNAKAHDAQLSEALQIELTDKTYELVKARLIPSKILVKLSIISITFIWLLEQANDGSRTGMLNDAYKASLGLTLRLIDKLLSATLYHASQDEFGIMHLGDRVKPAVKTLLPAFRIFFDWMNKQADQMRIVEWGQSSLQCNALFLKMSQLLEHLRKAFGFQFDIFTAVPRSNWDRFEDILKQQEEALNSDAEESESSKDLSVSTVSQKSKRRLLLENDEETQCSGLLPINGGLNDTPSGLATVRGSAQEVYRAQCILFTGVEISRLHSTFLELDEFEGENAEFNFVMMELEAPEEDEIIVSDDVAVAEQEVAAPVEDCVPEPLGIDETELYKQISRKQIPQELQSLRSGNIKQSSIPRGPGATSADHSNRAIELEKMQAQFIARPGSSAQSVNASASPEFLKKLRALESNGGPKIKGARGGKKRDGKSTQGSSASGEKERRNRGGTELKRNVKDTPGNAPSPKGSKSHQLGKKQTQPQVQHVIIESDATSSDAESNDVDSSDEEIVFLGRARAKH